VVPEPGAFAFDENRRRSSRNFHECVRGISVEVHEASFVGLGWWRRSHTSVAAVESVHLSSSGASREEPVVRKKSRAQRRGSRFNARGVIALAPFGRCGDGVG
jgi:hypothetical protein